MTAALFTGCLLVAFAFPTALFVLLAARKAVLLVVTLAAGFFWLVSLLISGLIWYFITPLQSANFVMVPLGVLIQELVRYAFFALYSRAERSFAVVSTNAIAFPMTDLYSSAAGGLGFGIVQCVMLYGSILTSALGPGTLFADTCSAYSTFVMSAWNSFCFGLLHVFWMVIAFDGYRNRSVPKVICLVLGHFLAALVTLLNTSQGGCEYSLPLLLAVTFFTGVAMFIIIQQSTYRSKLRRA